MRWFRFYAEALDDPKVQRLDGETFKHWVNLLCLAAKNNGTLPETADIAFALRIDEIAARSLLDRLLIGGLIEVLKGGTNGSRIAPHNWEERQYKSDSSSERVKRYRQRSKNVPETPPDTDTDTDTDIVICASEDARPDPVEEKVSHPPVEDVMEYWNELADKIGKQRIRKLSASRRQLVKARLREYSIEEFVEMFDNIEQSQFLRQWKSLGFDWVMKAGNFQKILEGNYNG